MNKQLNVIHGTQALLDHLAVCRMADDPVVVDSIPGMGKTEITKTLVTDMAAATVPEGFDHDRVDPDGVKLVEIRIGRHEEYDFPGIPWAKDDGMVIHTHPLLSALRYGDVCLLDEFKLKGANKFAMQFLEGKTPTCAGWQGDPHIFRVALANGADTGALECVESPVLGSRASQVEWTGPTAEESVRYMLETKHNPILVTAVRMEGDAVIKNYDPMRMRNAVPRTVTMASRAMDALERYRKGQGSDVTHEQRITMLASFLPDEVAMNIAAVFHLRDQLVPFSAIVSAPGTTPLPENPAAMMMLCSNVGNKTTPENYQDVMRYVERLPIEVQGAIVDPVLKRYPELGADPVTHAYMSRTTNLRSN